MDRGPADDMCYTLMPMTWNSLVVELWTRCTARCAVCYQSAGPQGTDGKGIQSLGVDTAERVIRESAAIETLVPRFHLSGGEPFLDLEACLRLSECAREVGFLDITAVTNAFWGVPRKRALKTARALREAGVTTLEVSWDSWHRAFVPPEAVANCLDACHEWEIETNLRVLTTRSHPVAEALSWLPRPTVQRTSRITSGPAFRSGRAALEIPEDDFYTSRSGLDWPCHGSLNLTVTADGNVYPCCAGMDQTTGYVIGNVHESSLADIAWAIDRSPIIRTVVFRGIVALADIIEARGVSVGRDYFNTCQMCRAVFSSPERVQAAVDHFVEVQGRAIRELMELLRAAEQVCPEDDSRPEARGG